MTRRARTGLIHIEYGSVDAGTLDYLNVWSSLSRGHWLPACEYWMSANRFHGVSVSFSNGYQSEELARILELATRQQNWFVLPPNLGRHGLLQISTPPAEQIAAAVIHTCELNDVNPFDYLTHLVRANFIHAFFRCRDAFFSSVSPVDSRYSLPLR